MALIDVGTKLFEGASGQATALSTGNKLFDSGTRQITGGPSGGILSSFGKSFSGGTSAGSFLGDAFGYDGATLTAYLNLVFSDQNPQHNALKFFYQQLFRDFTPDINGYTLIFFIPPDLSGYRTQLQQNMSADFNGDILYSQQNINSYMNVVGKLVTFAAVDFTPPNSQVNADSFATRSGKMQFATEVTESEQCSITFIDNSDLDLYMFHHIWVEYIREVLEGTIEPDPSYYTNFDNPEAGIGGDFNPSLASNYGSIDYAASCYIVKYRPDMKKVTFVCKCVGLFPQALPSKELIGTRTANDLTTLPFTYYCTGYREALSPEQSAGNWIFSELDEYMLRYVQKSESPLFSGFLGGILNKVIGPTSGMMANLTGNAAKLGGIYGQVSTAVKGYATSISGAAGNLASGNTSDIITVNSPKT